MTKRPETAVGAPVVAHLREMHWDVYQEVHMGMVADIVGVQGRVLWVIECKTSLGFDVIAQAARWVQGGWAHFVSVAVPWVKQASDGRALAMRVCGWQGIGCLEVKGHPSFPGGETEATVTEVARPTLHRSARFHRQLRDCLREEQKSQVAGTAGGGHWTPFRHTCDQLRRVVKETPGIHLKDALERIDHHYHSDSTARSALPKWIETGKFKGVRLEVEGHRCRLYPEEGAR